MPAYKDLSEFTGDKLWVVSSGWFDPSYSLTDGENVYGRIYHEGPLSSTTIFETNDFTLAAYGAANGDITLKTSEGQIIAHAGTAIFKRGLCLTFNNGSTATLSQPDMWKPTWAWAGAGGNCMMQIEGSIQLSLIFSCDKPLAENPDHLLLLFSAVKYLVYLHVNAS